MMLSMFVNEWRDNWHELLPFIMHAYRTSVHKSTVYSPFFTHDGRRVLSTTGSEYGGVTYQSGERLYDVKAVNHKFPVGSWVLRYYPPAAQKKLASPWIGPQQVV